MEYFDRIQKTINYIEDNINDEITLENPAEFSCYSPYHFHRIFQILTGTTVMDYIRKRRITEAANELKSTKKSIIEIAFFYHFNTHEAFTRAFKRYYGITPGIYRKSKIINIKPFNKIILSEKTNN